MSRSAAVKTDQRLEERDPRALDVEIRGRQVRLRQALLGTLLRALGALDVDVLRALADVREDRDTIRQDLHEPERDREVMLLLALPEPQLAHLQHRQQRRVARQHAEVAFAPRDDDLVDLLPEKRAIRCDDLECQLGR